MDAKDYLSYIVNDIHTVVIATVDHDLFPVTCAIDMMDADENSLYFLTAKGKKLYERLSLNNNLAFTAVKGNSTMDSIAVSVKGKVREIGSQRLSLLFDKNHYMYDLYPTEASRQALTVFQIYQGTGEWFDLSKKPIERILFAFGQDETKTIKNHGYEIKDNCNGCGICLDICPQHCITMIGATASIQQNHCLHCGNCFCICPCDAVNRAM